MLCAFFPPCRISYLRTGSVGQINLSWWFRPGVSYKLLNSVVLGPWGSEGHENLRKACKVGQPVIWEVVLKRGPEWRMPVKDLSVRTALSSSGRREEWVPRAHGAEWASVSWGGLVLRETEWERPVLRGFHPPSYPRSIGLGGSSVGRRTISILIPWRFLKIH